jgi:hypothetical protein
LEEVGRGHEKEKASVYEKRKQWRLTSPQRIAVMVDPADLNLCRVTLDRHLERTANGQYCLKVPMLQDLMQQGEGRHFHFAPEFFIQLSGEDDFDFPHEQFGLFADEICVLPTDIPHKEKAHAGKDSFVQIVIMLWETSGTRTVSWHVKKNTGQMAPEQIIATSEARRAADYLTRGACFSPPRARGHCQHRVHCRGSPSTGTDLVQRIEGRGHHSDQVDGGGISAR